MSSPDLVTLMSNLTTSDKSPDKSRAASPETNSVKAGESSSIDDLDELCREVASLSDAIYGMYQRLLLILSVRQLQ
jgi:hypothetical protein